MRSTKMAITTSLLLGACTFGPSAGSFEPARQPAGIETSIRLSGRELEGELLEVRDTALLVLIGDQVTLVPYRAIEQASFSQRGSLNFGERRTPEPWKRWRLRLVSRFPQGVEPDLLEDLLAAYGQSQLEVVER